MWPVWYYAYLMHSEEAIFSEYTLNVILLCVLIDVNDSTTTFCVQYLRCWLSAMLDVLPVLRIVL